MTVAVFFGGKSCEHNISVITGMQALKEIDSKYRVVPVYIDNEGAFFVGEALKKGLSAFKSMDKKKLIPVHLRPSDRHIYSQKGKKVEKIDCALICCHGLNGEDGTLQGLLELCGIPYTGSGVRASAAGMDKIMMKQVFEVSGLPVLPYVYFSHEEYSKNMFDSVAKIKEKLAFPMIVKPANLGSSIGISIAHDFSELYASITTAFEWDNRIVIENALTDFTELNCAVLGIGSDLTASQIEQPVGWKEFLTFDDKYVKKSKGGGRVFPAQIDEDLKVKVMNYAKTAFNALGCAGVARTDFLLKDGELYVNEINTVPGALSNYLFSYQGQISFTALIDKLIDIALKEKADKDRLKYSYVPSFEVGGVKSGNKGK